MNTRFYSTDPGDQSLMAKLLEKEVNKVEELRQLCTELAGALEYHQEQTRPIDRTTAALAKYREMVKP